MSEMSSSYSVFCLYFCFFFLESLSSSSFATVLLNNYASACSSPFTLSSLSLLKNILLIVGNLCLFSSKTSLSFSPFLRLLILQASTSELHSSISWSVILRSGLAFYKLSLLVLVSSSSAASVMLVFILSVAPVTASGCINQFYSSGLFFFEIGMPLLSTNTLLVCPKGFSFFFSFSLLSSDPTCSERLRLFLVRYGEEESQDCDFPLNNWLITTLLVSFWFGDMLRKSLLSKPGLWLLLALKQFGPAESESRSQYAREGLGTGLILFGVWSQRLFSTCWLSSFWYYYCLYLRVWRCYRSVSWMQRAFMIYCWIRVNIIYWELIKIKHTQPNMHTNNMHNSQFRFSRAHIYNSDRITSLLCQFIWLILHYILQNTRINTKPVSHIHQQTAQSMENNFDNAETTLEERYNAISGEVLCRFTTKLSSRFRVFDGQMSISTDMDENSLELLIKNLLTHNNNRAEALTEESLINVHFEFAIEGELLRGNLRSHILRYNLSSESVIDIEYFIALATPEQTDQIQQEDWISCIAPFASSNLSEGFVVGLFNGQVATYSHENKFIFRETLTSEPIKSIKTLPGVAEGSHHLLSAGLDQTIRLHLISEQERLKKSQSSLDSENMNLLANFTGFDNSIFSVDASPVFDGLFCAGGADKKLAVWRIPQDIQEQQQTTKKNKQGKKVKADIKEFQPEGVCEELHQDNILSVLWFSNEEIYTGSADHSIKVVDVQRMEPVMALQTKDSVNTSLDAKYNNILSAHEDGYIRLWDKRSETCVKTFKSHTKYASCVRYSASSNVFASSSYDGTVKIWDTRSIFPLETLSCHQDKVFGLLWKDKKQIVSVGSDSTIVVHSLETSTPKLA